MAHSSGGAALQEAISILFFTVFILFFLLLCQRGQFGSFNFSRLLNGVELGAGRHERRREPQGLPPDPDGWPEPSIASPRDKGSTDEQNRQSGGTTEPSERTDGLRDRRRERAKRSKEEEEAERLGHQPGGGGEELKTAMADEPEPQVQSREPADPARERRREERRTRRPEKVVDPVEPDTRTRTTDERITEPLKRRREVSSDPENELETQQRERERKAARLEREREIQELSPRTLRQRAKEREAKHQTRVPQPIRTAPLDYPHESLAGTSKHSAPPDRSYVPKARSRSPVSPVDGRRRRLRYQSGGGGDNEDVIDRPDSYTRLDDPPRSAPLELRHHRLQRDGDLSAPPQGSFSSTRREGEEADIRRDEERARARRQPDLRGGDLADDEGGMGHESRRFMRADKSVDSSAPSSSTSVTSPYIPDRLQRDQERGRPRPESRARRQGSKLSVDVPAPERVDRSIVVESATEPEVSPVVVVRPQHNRRGEKKRVNFTGVDSGAEGDQEDERRPARGEPKKKILKKDRDDDGGGGGRPPSPSGDYDNLEDLMRPSDSSSPKKGSKKPKSSGGGGGGGGGGSQRQATPTGDDDNLEDLMPPADRTTSPKRNSRRRKDESTASGSPKGGKGSSTPPPPGKKKRSARSGSGDESSGGGDDPRRVRIDINTSQGDPEKKGKKAKKSEGGGDDDGGGGEDDKRKKKKKKQTGESSDEPEDEEEGDGGKKKAKKGPMSGSKKAQKGKKDQAAVADDDEEEDDPANPPVKKKKKKPQAQRNGEDPDDDDDDPASKDNGRKKKKDPKQRGGNSGNGRGDDDDDDDPNDDGQRRQRRKPGNGGNDGSGRKGNQRRGYNNYDDRGDDDYAGGGGGGGGGARQRRRAQGGNYQDPQDSFFSQGGPMYNQGQPYPGQNSQSQNGQNPGFFNNMFTRAKNGDPQQGKGDAQGGRDIKQGDIATDGTTADAIATDGTTGIPGASKGTNQPPQTRKKGDPVKDATDADTIDQDPLAALPGGDPLDDDDSDESDDPFKAALKQVTGSGSGKDPSSKDGDPSKDSNSDDDGDGAAMGHRERPDRLTKEQRDAINDAEGEDSDADADGGGKNLDELERAKVEEVDRLVRDGSAEEIQRYLDQKDPSTKKTEQKDEVRDSKPEEPVTPTRGIPLAGSLDKEVAADVALDKENDKLPELVAGQGIPFSPRSKDTDTLNDASTPTADAPFPSPFLEPPSNGKDLGSRKAPTKDFEESASKSAQQSPVDDLPSPETLFSQRLEVEKQAGVAKDASSPSLTKDSQEQREQSYTPTEPAPLDPPRRRSPITDTFDGPTTSLETAPLPSPTVKMSGAASPIQASPSKRGLEATTNQDVDSDAHNTPKYAPDQLHDKFGATKATQDTIDSPDSPNYAADQLFYKTEEGKVNKDASLASPTEQKAAQADSSPLGLGKSRFPLNKSLEKDSIKDTDSILDAYTEQEPIRVTNVTTGNPTLVEDKDLHRPQQAEVVSVDDDRRSSVDSGYGTREPSPIAPSKMEQSKQAYRLDNLPSTSSPADVSPLSPSIQAKTQQPQFSEQVLDSPVSPASPVQAPSVQQKGQTASLQKGLPQVVSEMQQEDVEERQADDAGFEQTASERPEDKDSSDSDGERAPTIANQPQKTEAPRNNKQTMGAESEEEIDDKPRTKESVDPSIEAERKPAGQDEQKADSKTQAPDGTTLSPKKQTAQGSGKNGSASDASEAPGLPSNWERVRQGDKQIPSKMKTGGHNVPQGQTAPTQQQEAMAHIGHGEGEMRHKDKDRHKPHQQSHTELSDTDEEGSGGSTKARNMAGKHAQDLESQLPQTRAGGSFLHPWRLTRYTLSTIKHAPVWSAATLVCTVGYVGGTYFWYVVLNSSQASTATTLTKRAADSSRITSAASSVAKMGVNTQLAFSILNIYCFLGLLLLALMAHTTMEHAENPGQSNMEWLKHPFQTMAKGGHMLSGSVSGVLVTIFMQAGLNGPITFWHKMSWWTAMRFGLFVLELILLGLSNNQVISLTYMTITQEPNPPYSTWDVQYTASTLGLAAKSLDPQTLLALASAWLFFFVLVASWSWYSLLHPSAKHKGNHIWPLSRGLRGGCAPGWIVETIGVVVLIVVFGCFLAFFTEVMAVASKQVGGSSGQTSFMLANGVFLVFAVLMTWVGFELDKFGRWFWPKLSGTWCK